MTTATVTPRKRRAARTRQAIIDAARELITERGAQNLSLREIARRIEYSPAGLYEYFANKEEIVHAVILDGFERFGRYMFAIPTSLPANEYLHALGLSYIRFAMQNPEHFMLIFSRPELQTLRPPGQNDDEDYDVEGTFNVLTAGVQRMIDEGFLPPSTDVLETSFGNWSIVHGIAMLIVTQCQHMDLDWEAVASRLLYNLEKGVVTNAWATHEA